MHALGAPKEHWKAREEFAMLVVVWVVTEIHILCQCGADFCGAYKVCVYLLPIWEA